MLTTINGSLETVEDHGVGICPVCEEPLERGQVIMRSNDNITHAEHHRAESHRERE